MISTKNILAEIYKSGLKFLVPLTLEETYQIIISEAIKLVGGDGGSLYIAEGGNLKLVFRSAALPLNKIRKEGFTYDVFRQRQPKIIHVKEITKVHPEILEKGFKSVVFIPLSYRERSIGTMVIWTSKDEHFIGNEVDILKLFGSMASLAIRKTQLYDESKKALEARNLFLSMAAHEFRTPLTTISGYIQLLQGKISGSNTAESRWIEELAWESHRLTVLVNELLEVERIKSGMFHYNFSECPLKEIITRVLRDFRFDHPNHKIMIVEEIKNGQDKVIGDSCKLVQVFTNLLDNAAKFSSPDREIIVSLKAHPKSILVSVRDQGRGIHKKDLPNIFDRFFKGSESRQGMGLGLFVAKSIIARHRGEITIRSKINKGTTVEVRFPRAKL